MHNAHITPVPPDDEAAAVVAALAAYRAAEDQPAVAPETVRGWQQAAKLQVQGLQPQRTARPPRWNTVERLRRVSGFGGVIGL